MKRLLGAAIGDASPAVFDLEAQTAIAAWAVKTAMVADYLSADAERYCTARERAYLMRRSEPPPDVYVWIARYDGPWRCRSTLHHLRFPRRRDGRLVPAFSATFAIGRVALQVFSYRSRAADSDTFNVRRGPWDSGLIPLWPRTPGVAVIWPPRHSLSQETFVLLGNRFVMAPKPAGL